jgi:nitrate/nitrite transporter NarK
MFRSFLFAPGLTLLSSWFPPERRATAMGLYIAGNFSGNIVLSLVGPLMLTSHSWRFPVMVFSLAGMGVAVLFIVFAREKARRKSRDPLRLRDIVQLSRYRIVWLASAVQFIRMGPVVGISFWLPSFLVADRGLTIQTAGLVTAMGAALSAPSNAIGGYVSDRLNNPPLVIGGALTILACTTFLLTQVQSLPLLLIVIAVNSVFAQFYFGPLFLVPVEVLGQRTAGIVTGFCNLFANIGSVAFAYSLGVIKDRTGSFAWGFGAICLACIIGVLLSVALARTRRQALQSQAAA